MSDVKAELATLRERLNTVDRTILELVAERQSIVQAIGQTKVSSGIPTRDYARERQVIERARGIADELGLRPELAETLVRALIATSLESQEADRIAQRDHSGAPALVVGGAGKMGRWIAGFLDSQGYAVAIADEHPEDVGFPNRPDWLEDVDQWDVIILATPIAITADLLEALEQRRPRGLIFDVSSLKSPLRRPLRALADAGLRVTSVHPMFGPDTRLLSGRHVILVDVGHAEANAEARALFEPTMAELVEMSLEDHDRLISYVLGLSHALNIGFFTALRESGEASGQLARLSSTTFDAQLDVARAVAGDNPRLYFEIQSLNDYRLAPLNALGEAIDRLRSMVVSGDENGFVRLMELGREYLSQRPQWQDPADGDS
ncbi:MAG: bifunctional chorismate mutase/prephenate dehydrogenase [Pseudomonadota bacterium]